MLSSPALKDTQTKRYSKEQREKTNHKIIRAEEAQEDRTSQRHINGSLLTPQDAYTAATRKDDNSGDLAGKICEEDEINAPTALPFCQPKKSGCMGKKTLDIRVLELCACKECEISTHMSARKNSHTYTQRARQKTMRAATVQNMVQHGTAVKYNNDTAHKRILVVVTRINQAFLDMI